MDQVRQRGISVYFGQTGVNLGLAQLHQSETARSRSVAPLLVGFSAFLVGIMWRPQRLATALLVGLAALVASVRYFYKCVTCPDVVLPVLQVDLTLAGVVLFTAASFLILHSRATLVPHLLSFAVAYQLYLPRLVTQWGTDLQRPTLRRARILVLRPESD